MEVQRHTARLVDAVQQVAASRRDQQPAAVGGVDVEPDLAVAADGADRRQRVDDAAVGGAGGGRDGHRDPIRGGQRVQLGLERRRVHAAGGVDGDAAHRVVGQAEQQRGLGDAEVALGGGQDRQALLARRPLRSREAGECGLAGQEERLQVGLGAAGGEHPVGGGEAEAAADPADQPPLDEGADAGLVVGVHRGVHRRQHGLGGDGVDVERAVQMRQIGRMVVPDGLGEDELVDLAEHLLAPDAGSVQVDGGHALGELAGRGAGGRSLDRGEPGGDPLGRLGHQTPVSVGARRVDEAGLVSDDIVRSSHVRGA